MNKKEIIYYLFIVFMVCATLYGLYYVKHNVDAIIHSPFVYGANKLGGVSCSCIKTYENSPQTSMFMFNTTGFYPIDVVYHNPKNYVDFNPNDLKLG